MTFPPENMNKRLHPIKPENTEKITPYRIDSFRTGKNEQLIVKCQRFLFVLPQGDTPQ
jgi:hypothetical protein